MNINDYKDVNGNVLVSEQLISDLVDGANKLINPTTTTINTFENGWEGSITLKRYGDLVSIKGRLSKTGTVVLDGTQIAVVPVGFRPFESTSIAVAKLNTSPYNSSFMFWLLTSGSLQIRSSETIPANYSPATLGINQVYSV